MSRRGGALPGDVNSAPGGACASSVTSRFYLITDPWPVRLPPRASSTINCRYRRGRRTRRTPSIPPVRETAALFPNASAFKLNINNESAGPKGSPSSAPHALSCSSTHGNERFNIECGAPAA
ncbi:hypothetical protein EVAR_36885_1 [Eumeta japonica]|uniref:Uncharacterized protein n=1 Tax=Eumeta variegata TaxID=151549 RepID=A0A4C1WTS9_EUMVA|nr:hypothetical protein EVAR_36885_1 [Eumeta japonica]